MDNPYESSMDYYNSEEDIYDEDYSRISFDENKLKELERLKDEVQSLANSVSNIWEVLHQNKIDFESKHELIGDTNKKDYITFPVNPKSGCVYNVNMKKYIWDGSDWKPLVPYNNLENIDKSKFEHFGLR